MQAVSFLPFVIVRKGLFNEDGQHSTQAVIFVVKVCILEDLILSVHSIVRVHTKNETFTVECPCPFLEIE